MLDVIAYHYIFWTIYPMERLKLKGENRLKRYAFVSAGIFALIAAILFFLQYHYRDSATAMVVELFWIGSFIHITSSFFLSPGHPAWISRWFQENKNDHLDQRLIA